MLAIRTSDSVGGFWRSPFSPKCRLETPRKTFETPPRRTPNRRAFLWRCRMPVTGECAGVVRLSPGRETSSRWRVPCLPQPVSSIMQLWPAAAMASHLALRSPRPGLNKTRWMMYKHEGVDLLLGTVVTVACCNLGISTFSPLSSSGRSIYP